MNFSSLTNTPIHHAKRPGRPTTQPNSFAPALVASIAITLLYTSLASGVQTTNPQGVDPASTHTPTVPNTPTADSNSTEMALLLMKEQRYVEALRMLDASIGPRSTDVKSLHLAGLGLLLQNDHAKAAELLERALKLSPDDPAIVLNAAAARIRTGDSVRAAKFIYDALSKQIENPHESLVFGLIIAVDQIETNARKNRQYDLCVQLRDQAINSLESVRNTEKIWGVEWMSIRRFDRIQLRNANVRSRINETLSQINSAQEQIRKLKGDRETIIRNIRTERATVMDLDRVEARLAEQEKLATDASTLVVELFERLTVPVIPADIPPRWPDNSLVFPPPEPNEKPADPDDAHAPPDPAQQAHTPVEQTPTSDNGQGSERFPKPGPATQSPPPQPTEESKTPESVRFTITTRYATAISIGGGLFLTPASIIEGASAIDLIAVDSASHPARLVRIDADSGLALLDSTSLKLPAFAIADRFDGGEIQAAGFPTLDLFNTTPKEFSGTATLDQGHWSVELETSLAVPGAPMIADGRLVGLAFPAPSQPNATQPTPSAASGLTIVSPEAIRRIVKPDTATQPPGKPPQPSPAAPTGPVAKRPSDVVVLLVAWKRTPVVSK